MARRRCKIKTNNVSLLDLNSPCVIDNFHALVRHEAFEYIKAIITSHDVETVEDIISIIQKDNSEAAPIEEFISTGMNEFDFTVILIECNFKPIEIKTSETVGGIDANPTWYELLQDWSRQCLRFSITDKALEIIEENDDMNSLINYIKNYLEESK